MSRNSNDKGYFRRKFPRRILKQKVGILCRGKYFLASSGELGEGGMSVLSDLVLDLDSLLVISFQIPSGEFVSVRAAVKSAARSGVSEMNYGVAFEALQFGHRRQIRSYVSARRTSAQEVG